MNMNMNKNKGLPPPAADPRTDGGKGRGSCVQLLCGCCRDTPEVRRVTENEGFMTCLGDPLQRTQTGICREYMQQNEIGQNSLTSETFKAGSLAHDYGCGGCAPVSGFQHSTSKGALPDDIF